MGQEKLNIPALVSWDEVDNCLREISECKIAKTTIEGEMNITINDAKEKAAALSAPMDKRIKHLSLIVQTFVESVRADMDGKTKALNFGKVGFRQSSSVTVPTSKLPSIIKAMKKYDMEDCIRINESVDKEALEKYPDKDILKIGCSRKVKDTFFLEPDLEKVRKG